MALSPSRTAMIVSGCVRLISIASFIAFRDRNAGSRNNRDKPVEETADQGNRGGRGPRRDRQSRTGQA